MRRHSDARRGHRAHPSRLATVALYVLMAGLTVTGLAWLYPHYRNAGAGLPDWTANVLAVHGALAIAAGVVFGMYVEGHVRRHWRHSRNRPLGLLQVAAWLALLLTGYALYYLASEETRPSWSTTHWVVGLGVPLALLAHVINARRTRAALRHGARDTRSHPSRGRHG